MLNLTRWRGWVDTIINYYLKCVVFMTLVVGEMNSMHWLVNNRELSLMPGVSVSCFLVNVCAFCYWVLLVHSLNAIKWIYFHRSVICKEIGFFQCSLTVMFTMWGPDAWGSTQKHSLTQIRFQLHKMLETLNDVGYKAMLLTSRGLCEEQRAQSNFNCIQFRCNTGQYQDSNPMFPLVALSSFRRQWIRESWGINILFFNFGLEFSALEFLD